MHPLPSLVRRSVLPVLFVALCALPLAAQSRYVDVPWDHAIVATNSILPWGQSVSGIGDLDGDGVADVVLGVPASGLGYTFHPVTVRSGRTGKVLLTIDNSLGIAGFGRTVEAAGDIDSDGLEDFFLGSTSGPGALYSGADGSRIRDLTPAPLGVAPAHFGRMPDLDGDGVPELLVGNSNTTSTRSGCCSWSVVNSGPRRVQLLDGATGAPLLEVNPPLSSAYGSVLGAVGDVDGDGRADFGVGAGVLDPMGYITLAQVSPAGFDVYSSATGELLWRISSVVSTFTRLGDLDDDGVVELALGGMQDESGFEAVEIRSGADGSLIRRYWGRTRRDGFGLDLDAEDWDGDGAPDLIVGANDLVGVASGFVGTFYYQEDGYVQVIDVRRDRILATFEGVPEDWGLGAAVVAIGDATGDGHPDLVALAPRSDVHLFGGTMRVLSQAPLRIRSSRSELSLATGGSLVFQAQLGAAHAGDRALLIGSASGISPPTFVHGVRIPLVFDPYSRFLFARQSPLSLDGNGEAIATIRIPPGLPLALVGLTLDHAFLVFDGATGRIEDASASLPVVFTN